MTAFGISVLAFAALAFAERRAEAPALPPALLSLSRVRKAIWCALATNFLWYGLWFALALWLESVRGLSALETGLFFLPATLPMSVVPPLTTRAIGRFGARRLLLTGFATYLVGAALLVGLGATAPLWAYALAALIFSFAATQVVPSVTAELSLAAPARYAATGQGALYAARQAGSALGVAVVSAVGVTDLPATALVTLVGAALALVLIAFGGRARAER